VYLRPPEFVSFLQFPDDHCRELVFDPEFAI
jgi:hypothetical protein